MKNKIDPPDGADDGDGLTGDNIFDGEPGNSDDTPHCPIDPDGAYGWEPD